MKPVDYWEECLANSMEENGVAASHEQLTAIAGDIAGAHENYGMAFYRPSGPSQAERDLQETKRLLQVERDKILCKECGGSGEYVSYGISRGSRGCVLWQGALDKHGRGRVWVGGKLKLAHRAVWERVNGPIPAGKLLCHTCDNPTCVNPAHLYVGTHADNMRDMKERRRTFAHRYPERARESGRRLGKQNTWFRGAGNPRAKLTPEQVSSIQTDRRPTKALAEQYGVHRTTIQKIRSGKQWTS